MSGGVPRVDPDWRFLWGHPAHAVALGLGAGLIPRAPGTFGTLLGFPLYAGLRAFLSPAASVGALGILFVLGIAACDRTGRDLGVHDHGAMVWDEIVAFALVLVWAPATPTGWVVAFALFRCFDILKPFPVDLADRRVGGGLGVMLDDLLAAAYAVLAQEGLGRLLHA